MAPLADRHDQHELETEHFHLETVLAGLCYADIFDFPVRIDELKSYLPLQKLTSDEIQQALDLLVMQKRAYLEDGFYSFRPAPELVAERKRRLLWAEAKWQQAAPFLSKLLAFRFINGAVLTGSVAANNANEHADVDLMLVLDHRRMWFGYALIRLWTSFQSDCHACPNYVIGDNQLELLYPGYFTAVEFALARPIKSIDVFQEMEETNTWLREWTPSSKPLWAKARQLTPDRRWYHGLIEWLVQSPIGAALNALERKRIAWRTKGLYQPTPYTFKPHAPHRMLHIHQSLSDQLAALGIEESDLGRHLNQSVEKLRADAAHWDAVQGSAAQAPVRR